MLSEYSKIELIEQVESDLRVYCETVIIPYYDNINPYPIDKDRLMLELSIAMKLSKELFLDANIVYTMCIFNEITINNGDMSNYDVLTLIDSNEGLEDFFTEEQIQLIATACKEYENDSYEDNGFSSTYSRLMGDIVLLQLIEPLILIKSIWKVEYDEDMSFESNFKTLKSRLDGDFTNINLEEKLNLTTSKNLYLDVAKENQSLIEDDSKLEKILNYLIRNKYIEAGKEQRSNISNNSKEVFNEQVINETVNQRTEIPKLFHLSERNLNNQLLKPGIPDNFMIQNGYEDNKIKRICFSTNIQGCLIALSQNLKGKEFYVHEPSQYNSISIQKPTIQQVPDSKVTNEIWVTNDCRIKKVGKIRVIKAIDKPIPYTFGNGKKAELYAWEYEWIGKPVNEKEPAIVNEELQLLNESAVTNRKKIEELIYKTLTMLDPTNINTNKYKNKFKNMNDKEFNAFINNLMSSDDENFYMEILTNKNEPKLKNILETLKFLGVPAEEFVYYRNDGNKDNPLRTAYPVPVGYITIKRLQQMLSKKNSYSLDISKRNMLNGQVTGDSKVA